MAQQLQHTGNPTYFVVILLLLSYVMSSAPKYLRDMKEEPAPKTAVDAPGLLDQVKKLAKAYTIAPYQRVWENFQLKGAVAAILP
jgi:hypothetical protein